MRAGMAYEMTLQGQEAAGLADFRLSDILVKMVLPQLNVSTLVAVRATCHGLYDLLEDSGCYPLWASATSILLPEPQLCGRDANYRAHAFQPQITSQHQGSSKVRSLLLCSS